MRTKLHGGNNLAFAEFEKIHTPPFGCEIPSFQLTALDRDVLVVGFTPAFFGDAPFEKADALFD